MKKKHDLGKCKNALAAMSDYLDREVDDKKLKSLETHFAGCPPCLLVLKTLRKTIQVFARGGERLPARRAAQLHRQLARCIEREAGAK